MYNTAFSDLCRSLDQAEVRSQDSVDDFYWRLASCYDGRWSKSLEYFADRDDLLQQEMTEHLIELDLLETRYTGLEEYEKCIAVRDIRADLTQKYRQHLVKT